MKPASEAVRAGSRSGGIIPYYISVVAFFACLALLLFTIVEMRRGFLFSPSDYLKVGAPSAILFLNPWHVPLLAAGGLGALLAYRFMARLERDVKGRGVSLKGVTRVLALAVLVLLIADLFTYRGVPAARIVSAGKIGVGQALPAFPAWLQPVREGINYLALVWHATMLGVLLGALFLTEGARFLKNLMGGRGFKAHATGAAMAVSQPFCSCCAAPIGGALYRQGASLGPTLAFVVSAPMLNVTALILAATLLPLQFAFLRIAGGIFLGVFVTYAATLLASRWGSPLARQPLPNRFVRFSSGIMQYYGRLFRFEDLLAGRAVDSPAALVRTWLTTAWRLARVVVPVLLVGSLVTAALVMALPSPGNGVPGVVIAAAFGTLLMVPTWTEIPVAASFIRDGLAGPAAALLLTLPAVSVPCLAIVGGAVNSGRVAIALGFLVFAVGTVAGLAFLAL